MYNTYFGSDPTFMLSNLELQKSQLGHQVNRARQELTRVETAYKTIDAQISALKGQMAPAAQPANPLEEALKKRGLTSEQLQTALSSPQGQALTQLFDEELMKIVQDGAPPQAAN